MRSLAGSTTAGGPRKHRERLAGGSRTRRIRAGGVLLSSAALALAVLAFGLFGCSGSGGSTDSGKAEFWVWLDAGLLEPVADLSNLLAAVDSAADCGADGVVLELKTRTGESLLPTPAFPVAKDVLRVLGGSPLEAVAEKCRQRGVRLALGDHVFYGGNVRMRRGLVFSGARDWAVVRVGRRGLIRDTENPELSWARLCPVNPDVRKAELNYLGELAKIAGIERIWIEGVGFPDLWSGFSPAARARFEAWLENKVKKWPDDVLSRLGRDDSLKAGHYLRQWLLWRALEMKAFVREATGAVRTAAPNVTVGVIVGGWLPRSYEQGLNWAPASYKWMSRWLPPGYGRASCAADVQRLGVGLFFPYVREKDAKKGMRAEAKAEGFDPGWFSVEGCAKRVAGFPELSKKATGVVHAGVWGGDVRALKRALKAAARLGDVLVLDASTLNENHAWNVLRQR